MKKFLVSILLLTILCSSKSWSNVRLPSILGNHMVLQQNSDIKLWGWADPNERIRVNVDWDTTTFTTNTNGGAKWSVQLKTPKAGGPFKIIIKGKNTITLEDVLIGEVWVCSGQSNMEMNMNWGLKQYEEDAANANNQQIRFFNVPKSTSDYPQEDTKGEWVVCSPEEMKKFSAVGYFFGNRLQQELKSPIGLINSSWGGTPAEVWTPKEYVESDSALKRAALTLKPNNGWPVATSLTYNAMIFPIINYAIAGAIWYQGESNVGNSATYQTLFTNMISSWRKSWNKEFPFYFVQIAPYSGYGSNNNNGALLRDAQSRSAQFSNTGMVVITDLVDDIKDIHPKNKKDVGLRLANYALAQTYGQNGLAYRSPSYKNFKIEKDKIRVYFDNAPSGLKSKTGTPSGFYIAGEDKNFQPAKVKIDGSSVLVWNENIKKPVAVRFGFSNDAIPDLFSKEGLPVNLFRTDDWDIITGVAKQ